MRGAYMVKKSQKGQLMDDILQLEKENEALIQIIMSETRMSRENIDKMMQRRVKEMGSAI